MLIGFGSLRKSQVVPAEPTIRGGSFSLRILYSCAMEGEAVTTLCRHWSLKKTQTIKSAAFALMAFDVLRIV